MVEPLNKDDSHSDTDEGYRHSMMLDYDCFDDRMGFIKKVYGILSAQMAVTTAFILFVQLKDEASRLEFMSNTAIWIWPAFFFSITIEIAILCCRNVARKVPLNYIMLLLFTLSFSFIVGWITGGYAPQAVIEAGVATLATTVALTIYALTTKDDYTIMGGLLWILGVGIMMLCLGFTLFGSTSMGNTFLTVLCVVFYGIFLVYDT